MRLQPQALGDLTINMNLQPGSVGATFTVASAQARDLLQDHMTLLRSALEARGLDVERLDVRLAQPAEPGEGARADPRDQRNEPHDHQHPGEAGGEQTHGRDAHGRREAPFATVTGSEAGGAQRDENVRAQDAPALGHSALRIWSQQVESGGARVLHLKLDAVA
jgi:hypothetical protein